MKRLFSIMDGKFMQEQTGVIVCRYLFTWCQGHVSPSSSNSKVLTSSPLPSDTTALYEPASFFVT